MAAEQKARTTYDNILKLSDDPDVNDVIKFLRAREIVHYQRFGEANHTDLSGFQEVKIKSFRSLASSVNSSVNPLMLNRIK